MTRELYVWCLYRLGGASGAEDHLYARWVADHDGRAYHNLDHIQHALGVASMLAFRREIDEGEWALVAFALLNHDRVYDPRQKDNEERSAERAMEDLMQDQSEVRRLILLTKEHVAEPEDVLGTIVVDSDLAILCAPDPVYRRYAEGVRAEYTWLPEREYREGRAAILSKLLERARKGTLFSHDILDHESAKRNLEAELARL